MHWFRRLWRRRYDDLSVSIQSHLEEMADELMDDGLTKEEAMLRAQRAFGNVTLIQERSREVWRRSTLEAGLADLRFAFRQLGRAPGFFLTAILVLALGIAASVTVFSFVNAALIKPLPYQNPARLVALFGSTLPCQECGESYLDYQDWRGRNSVFRSLEVWQPRAFLLRNSGGVEALRAGRVSGGFFATLGVAPALGRLFTVADDTPAAPRTVVLTDATWRRYFGGRAGVLGQAITLDDDVYTVIGVLPRDFQFAPRAAELWVTVHDLDSCDRDRSCRVFNSFARLNDGISISAARANIKAVAAQLEKQFPQSNDGQGASVKPLTESLTGEIQPILLVLLAGSVLLLLIACANLAGLLLVRAENRRREMAVRSALGASLARLTRQLMTESALLVALSLCLGLATAKAAVHVLATLIPERVLRGMPYFESMAFDRRVVLFAATVGLLAWVICTAAPVTRLFGTDLRARLADGGRGSSAGWRRFGSNLVVVELATAMVLLVGAGVLSKSFYRILQVDLKFNPDHLATLEIDANTGYDTRVRQTSLANNLIEAIAGYPGITSVAIVKDQLPVTCNCGLNSYRVHGRPWSDTQRLAISRSVSSAYWKTLQARLLSGRFFTELDDASHAPVVVINRTMADTFFPGENPIGSILGDDKLSEASLHQVIGVVDDVREGELNSVIYPTAYFSLKQDPGNYFFVVARTAQEPDVALPGIVATIHRLNLGIGARNEFTMVEHIHHGAAYYLHSSAAWLAGGFAAAALMLGVVGLYGVMAYSVSQRTCEIGIRMALGARRSSIRRLILGEAAWLVLLGLASGIAASLLSGRFLQFLLFGVRAWDLTVLVVVSLVFSVVALLSAWIPAERAAATDPMGALRNE